MAPSARNPIADNVPLKLRASRWTGLGRSERAHHVSSCAVVMAHPWPFARSAPRAPMTMAGKPASRASPGSAARATWPGAVCHGGSRPMFRATAALRRSQSAVGRITGASPPNPAEPLPAFAGLAGVRGARSAPATPRRRSPRRLAATRGEPVRGRKARRITTSVFCAWASSFPSQASTIRCCRRNTAGVTPMRWVNTLPNAASD